MSRCQELKGLPLNKGEIIRTSCDLDGRPVPDSGEPKHYFIVLSYLYYNKNMSKKAFLAIELSSKSEWLYSRNLIIPDDFENWSNAVSKGNYYQLFFNAVDISYQADKVVRVCQENVEYPTGRKDPILRLKSVSLNRIVCDINYFMNLENELTPPKKTYL